MYNVIVAAGS